MKTETAVVLMILAIGLAALVVSSGVFGMGQAALLGLLGVL